MKFALPRRRLYRIALYTLSIFIILLAVDLLWVRMDRHITVSPETTHITSPLKPDGMPDYVRYIQDHASAGITAENNAAVILQKALGPTHFPEFAVGPLYERLGLPVPQSTAGAANAISYVDFLKEQHRPPSQADELDESMRTPWTSADHPDLAACLQRNRHALTLFHEAAQLPRYYCPMIASPGHDEAIAMFVLQLGPLRSLCQLAISQAMMSAADSHFADAQTHLIDVHKIARLLAQQPTLIEAAAAYQTEESACIADQALACSEKLSASDARAFLGATSRTSSPSRRSPTPSKMANVSTASTPPSSPHASDSPPPTSSSDTLPVLTESGRLPASTSFTSFRPISTPRCAPANYAYDQLLEATRAPTFSQRMAIAHKMEQDVQHVYESTWNPATRLLSYIMPSLTRILVRHDSAATELDLTRVSFALAAFHAEHHAYPHALSDLSPGYLPTIPNDLFADAPFQYEPHANGYTVRSVGPRDPVETHPGTHYLTVVAPAHPPR